MDPRLEIKQKTINKKKAKALKNGVILIIVGSLSFLILIINNSILKNPSIYNIGWLIFIIGISCLFIGAPSVISISNEDKAFLEILKTLEIVESTFISDNLNKENVEILNMAYKYIWNAANYLKSNESFTSDATSWNLKNKDIENRFIQNLQIIVAPAVKQNKLPLYGLEQIAFLFVDSNISNINEFNKDIEKSFKEIEPYEEISFYHKIINSKYGWLIKPAISGIGIVIIALEGNIIITGRPMNELFIQYYYELWGLGIAIFASVLASPYLIQQLSKNKE
jgi:hypothetical protein